jgi:hypothetical protein
MLLPIIRLESLIAFWIASPDGFIQATRKNKEGINIVYNFKWLLISFSDAKSQRDSAV